MKALSLLILTALISFAAPKCVLAQSSLSDDWALQDRIDKSVRASEQRMELDQRLRMDQERQDRAFRERIDRLNESIERDSRDYWDRKSREDAQDMDRLLDSLAR